MENKNEELVLNLSHREYMVLLNCVDSYRYFLVDTLLSLGLEPNNVRDVSVICDISDKLHSLF